MGQFSQIVIGIALILSWSSLRAWAIEPSQEMTRKEVQAPCGIFEGFAGDVEVLDATRTHLLEIEGKSALPCGSWIAVKQGWAQIRHQNGPYIHLGNQTFVQILGGASEDQLSLYRGQVYIQVGDGEREFRIISASGRARMRRSKTVFIYSPENNETQLISLQHSATLENRFETSRVVRVQAGESTQLNFKLLRVIPSIPQAVSVASLRPKLAQLRLTESDQFEAVRAVVRRQGRQFAADSTPISRKPASTSPASVESNYLRHSSSPEDSMLHDHWIKKMVGENSLGERVLFPDQFYGKTQRVQVKVEDPSEKLKRKQQAQDEEEKKKLIEELSHIHVE